MTIRTRLTFWYAGILTASLVVIGFGTYREIDEQLRHAHRRAPEERAISETGEMVFRVGLPAILLGLLGGWWLTRRALSPVAELTEAIKKIHERNLREPLPRTGNGDELDRLTEVFNGMLARLDDSFSRTREFTLHASHELKTPLTVINANAQLIRRWGESDPAVTNESLNAIVDESARLAEMVGGMLTLAKADSGDQIPREPLALNPIVADVVVHARERAAHKGLALRAEFDPQPAFVLGDVPLIRQLVANLIDNAIKFTEAGEVVASVRHAPGTVSVAISDTGPGISTETAERLFDRFFRGDPSHSRTIEGTGLGLAIVRSIARVHGGTVAARPRPEGGSVFEVTFPAIEMPAGDPLLTENQ